MESRRHILCTGGAGFIGSHTVVSLIESGFDVTIVDNFYNANPKVIPAIEKVVGCKIPVENVSLVDYEAVLKIFKKRQVDGVIHFAAYKSVGESVSKPLEYYENNLRSFINVLKAMRETNCHIFVQSSSACVYKADEDDVNRSEDSPLGAPNPYGQTKVMAEQILQDCSVADPKLKVSILRYFNPVGAHPSGELGDCPVKPQCVLPVIQQTAVGLRDVVYVYGNDWNTPDGTGVRDYIHVMDLAEGHVVALQQLDKIEGGCLVHNLGTGEGTSVLQLLEAFSKSCGKQVPYKIVERRPGDVARSCADPSKALREWNWKPTRSIQESCDSAWKFQIMHPNG